MYAVAGTWSLDRSQAAAQAESLRHIVAGVRDLPGFIRGFWSRDVAEPEVNVTYIVFETLQQAQDFRASVAANAPRQADVGVSRNGLRIVEIEAEA